MVYIYSFIGIAIGALIVVKTEAIIESFGHSAWAEEHLGSEGGTRLLYKLIGLAIIILSLLAMTGQLGNIILGIIGPLFGIKR